MTEPPRIDSIDELRPDLRLRSIQWRDAVRSLGGRASGLVILETRRTPARQDWLWASGRDRPGLRVTNLRGSDPRARHVAGPGQATALDFAFQVPGLSLWDDHHPWELAGVAGEYLGARWGGRWQSRDLGHLEWPPVAPSVPVLRRGARGERVAMLQRSLAARGFEVGPIDGIYGSATELAVRAFEAAAGLRVDGEVDADVATRLGFAVA